MGGENALIDVRAMLRRRVGGAEGKADIGIARMIIAHGGPGQRALDSTAIAGAGEDQAAEPLPGQPVDDFGFARIQLR